MKLKLKMHNFFAVFHAMKVDRGQGQVAISGRQMTCRGIGGKIRQGIKGDIKTLDGLLDLSKKRVISCRWVEQTVYSDVWEENITN